MLNNFQKPKRTRAKKIRLSSRLEDTIYNLITIHNNIYPKKKVKLEVARRVVNRGIKDSGIEEAGIMRLKLFMKKRIGVELLRYNSDNDLL